MTSRIHKAATGRSHLHRTGPPAQSATSKRIAPPYGTSLTEGDYKNLESSWISREIAIEAMLRRVDDCEAAEVLGRSGRAGLGGIFIPYYLPESANMVNYRIRRDNPGSGAGRLVGAPWRANRRRFGGIPGVHGDGGGAHGTRGRGAAALRSRSPA